jgi:Tfp pilus assembly protein PilF
MKARQVSAPGGAEEFFSKGIRCLDSSDFAGAARAFRRAIRIAPDLTEAHINLGVALESAGLLQEAEACYAHAVSLSAGGPQAFLNLGALLVNQKRLGEAGQVYRTAAELFPDSAALWSNLGVLHACLQDEAEAERCCRRALALDATYTKARFNLSYLLLRQGRLEEGWQALEARPWSLDLSTRIPGPRWQGESLAGKSLLIGCEGGYGDMIQFGRYAAVLKSSGAERIGIICQPALKKLFATLAGVDVVVALGEMIPGPGWDFWTLPQSIPLHCGTRLDTIPAPIPYLWAPPLETLAWRSRLPSQGHRVGLAWQGNPRFENDPDRSLPGLHVLAPLAFMERVCFISLRISAEATEPIQPPAGMELLDPSSWIGDFSDSAALVSSLDLVISVDTAAAHLAGALGIPCWVLLPCYKTDWRWFKDREDSPWYPGSMRLFRQQRTGDWTPVIAAVAAALQRLVRGEQSSG